MKLKDKITIEDVRSSRELKHCRRLDPLNRFTSIRARSILDFVSAYAISCVVCQSVFRYEEVGDDYLIPDEIINFLYTGVFRHPRLLKDKKRPVPICGSCNKSLRISMGHTRSKYPELHDNGPWLCIIWLYGKLLATKSPKAKKTAEQLERQRDYNRNYHFKKYWDNIERLKNEPTRPD